jgi:hypothetical protein
VGLKLPFFCLMLIISPRLISFLTLGSKDVTAMAIWPFIIGKSEEVRRDEVLLNHERIHLRQQGEMLLIFFLLWYLLEYLYFRFLKKYSHFQAYKSISFEREAYQKDRDLQYLSHRPMWASFRFFK